MCGARSERFSTTSSPMDHTQLKIIPHPLRPARGGAAGVVIVFALLLSIAAKSGLFGLPLALILTSWFFKYAYILFDHTVHGFDEPPALDIQMLNPLDEQRPLAQVAILGLIYAAVYFAQAKMGPTPGRVIAVAAALFLPASVAILGLERNIVKAAYPVAWVRMILGLGPMYALVLAIIGGYSLLIALLGRWELWLPVQIAIYMFCILSVFSVLGGALYERRHELGLETWASPERTEELQRKHDLRDSEKAVTDAYGQVRVGSHTQAWQQLQTWLTSRGNAPDDYRWLCGRVAAWVAATLGADAPGAVESSTVLSPQTLQEIAQVEAEIDRIEAQAIQRLAVPPDNQVQQVELLGKLMLYDKQLSVNRNEACAFCHMPETGFTGPVSELNWTTGAYPGSVRTRFSDRKPQSRAYAPLSPVLHYNSARR